MKYNNNEKSIQATSPSATSLKAYKAPSLTSYGDVSKITKATYWRQGSVDHLWNYDVPWRS